MNWMQQAAEFMPHGMCLLWRPELVALHVASDAGIAAAYFVIPFAIALFVRRRDDLAPAHRVLALLFAAFITLCGMTHVLSIMVLWLPVYISEGWLKAVTATVSLITAGTLPFLMPHLLAIPSPRRLQSEVEAHKATMAALDAARAELARRVVFTERELELTNRRFRAALKDSPITVFEQDAAFRYTWAYNVALGLTPDALIGRTETDFMTAETAAPVQAIKARALETNSSQRGEFYVEVGDRAGWFDLRVEPTTLENGELGLIATSTEITERRNQEEHLRFLTREMNHRAKNVLAMVIGIARQTARRFEVPLEFEERLNQRLASLASAHDVLASQRWRGASLMAVMEGQLRHHLDTYGDRIRVEGEPCDLPPDAAHYIGLALHELGSNAVKYGALSGESGTVTLRWRLVGSSDASVLELIWSESGGPKVKPPKSTGFGATILQTMAARALQGESRMDFRPAGLVWTLTAPLHVVASTG